MTGDEGRATDDLSDLIGQADAMARKWELEHGPEDLTGMDGPEDIRQQAEDQ